MCLLVLYNHISCIKAYNKLFIYYTGSCCWFDMYWCMGVQRISSLWSHCRVTLYSGTSYDPDGCGCVLLSAWYHWIYWSLQGTEVSPGTGKCRGLKSSVYWQNFYSIQIFSFKVHANNLSTSHSVVIFQAKMLQ